MTIPRVGQTWERFDGSRFTIERIQNGYAEYWLERGSRPQFRSIRLDRLTGPARNFRLLKDAAAPAPVTHDARSSRRKVNG